MNQPIEDTVPDKHREITISDTTYQVCYFDDPHDYTINGEHADGITTVLGRTINKPALINWAIKLSCEALAAGIDIKEAKKAPNEARDAAAKVGTETHAAIEAMMNGLDQPPIGGLAMQRMSAFARWLDRMKPEVHEVEQIVAMPFGLYKVPDDFPFSIPAVCGTLDLDLSMEARRGTLDVKSGNNIWPENWVQNLFYATCRKLEGVAIDMVWILHLPPEKDAQLHAMTYDDCMQIHGAGLIHALLGQCWLNEQKAFKARTKKIKDQAAARIKLQSRTPRGPVTHRVP